MLFKRKNLHEEIYVNRRGQDTGCAQADSESLGSKGLDQTQEGL